MMGFWDNVKIALEALRGNKMRSLLTTLAIIMGITTIVAIVSVIDGLNTTVFKNISAIGSSTLYVQKWEWASQDWLRFRNRRDLGWKEYHALEKGVTLAEAISPSNFTARTVKYGSRSLDFVAVSGVAETYAVVADSLPAAGRFLIKSDVDSGRRVAVIGAKVATELFQKKNPIGQKISVGGNTFKVVGVLEERGDFFDMNLDTNVLIPFSTFNKVLGSRRSMTIMIKPRNPADTREIEDQIVSVMRRVRKLRFQQENDLPSTRSTCSPTCTKNSPAACTRPCSLWALSRSSWAGSGS